MQIAVLPFLGLLFIALKLTHYIAWSWLLVLLPFWIGFAILAIVFFMGFGITLLVAILEAYSSDKSRKRGHQRGW